MHTLLQKLKNFSPFLHEFLLFGIKQSWACLFGSLLLLAILASSYSEWTVIHRYDFLFLYALAIQGLLIVFKLESPAEAKAIFLFHIVGTVMEIFKTSSAIGSWSYPEASIFHIGNVPLFSGFMYSAVGSYIARSWRIMQLHYSEYPKRSYTIVLAILIYLNFFTHHYIWDIRSLLFIATFWLFWKAQVHFIIDTKRRKMPLLLAFFLISFFIWLAENVGTFAKVWLYPTQEGIWHMVSWSKLGSWFLLMIISFVMVEVLHSKGGAGSSKQGAKADVS